MGSSCELFLVCDATDVSNGSHFRTEEDSAEEISLGALKII